MVSIKQQQEGNTAALSPQEKITVAGGWQTEVAKVWSSVEQYDDASGQWVALSPMLFERQGDPQLPCPNASGVQQSSLSGTPPQ